jgi:hypothetical protein
MTKLQQVRQWVADAMADGWDYKPTYAEEHFSQAITLNKNGYIVMAIMRPVGTKFVHKTLTKDDVNLHIWGPDGLAVDPPKAGMPGLS